jgi:hypothetical protein
MPRSTSRKNRRTGAGYLMPAEYYNPNARQPSAPNASTISAAPVTGWIRPPISATHVIAPAGGRRNKRKTMKGGFAAELMGAFAANAHSAIVPLALLGLYAVVGAKKTGSNNTRKSNAASSNKHASSNKAASSKNNSAKSNKSNKN